MGKVEWKEFPESYFVGQEYIDLKDRMDVDIVCSMKFPALFNNLDITENGVRVEEKNGFLNFTIQKQIPAQLYLDIGKNKADNFIMGYFISKFSFVNNLLLKLRYEHGHILTRSISLFEIEQILVKSSNSSKRLNWPPSILPFPFKSSISIDQYPFVKDYIDSMIYYLHGDWSNSIAKSITSLENFISLNKSHFSAKESFLPNIKSAFTNKHLPWGQKYLDYLYENIKFVYKVRNKIVHEGFSVSSENKIIAKKGIGTLSYLYQGIFTESLGTKEYVGGLVSQFLLLDGMYSNYLDLDEIARYGSA